MQDALTEAFSTDDVLNIKVIDGAPTMTGAVTVRSVGMTSNGSGFDWRIWSQSRYAACAWSVA